MAEYDFDLFVIGGGSGGVRAARISGGHGARVGLCEESRMGGTCVIRGCVPKKLMVFASHFSEDFEDAQAYGWEIDGFRFSWSAMKAARDKEILRLEAIYHKLLKNAGVEHIEGRGRLLDSHTIQVGERTVTAEKIVLATGGRPYVPEFAGSEHAITSDEFFQLEQQPGRVIVVGGGYIATELAGIYNGLGTHTTQVYRGDALLRGFDQDVRELLTEEVAKKGVNLRLETDIIGVQKTSDGVTVELGNGERISADNIMYCTGRIPYTWDLGLETVGLETDGAGAVPVDDYSQSAVENIYAVGDVTNRIALTPVATHEGHALADTLYGNNPRPSDHRMVPSAVFSQPTVGTVGYPEHEAREKYGKLRIYTSSFRPMKHTITGRDEKMMVKVIVDDATDVVVGCHIVGPDAAEIVQGFGVAVKAGLRKAQFDATIGIHPTSAEELVTLRVATSE